MTGRLFSPTRVVLGLVLLAALVVGGLAWVSVAALGVEAAQREADARNEAATRERFALWRLDGFLLPVVGLENNRPYSHYFATYAPAAVALDAAGDPTADPGRIPSPLLTADLPPWMTLHFQLDPERGWESPQVISVALEDRLSNEPFGLSLVNCTPQRAKRLNELRAKFPASDAARALADQERSEPDEPPFLVPVPQADDPILEKPTPFICPDILPGWVRPAATEQVACGRGGAWCDLPETRVAVREASKQQSERVAGEADKDRELAKKAEEGTSQITGQALPQKVAPPSRSAVPDTESSRDALARKNIADNVQGSRAGYEPGGKLQSNPVGDGGRGGRGNFNAPQQKGAELKAALPTQADGKDLEKQVGELNEFLRNEIVKLKELRDLQKQQGKGDDSRKESDAAKDTPNDKAKDPSPSKKLDPEVASVVRPVRPSDALVEQRGRRLVNDYLALAKEGGAVPPVEAKAGPLVVPVAVHLGPVRPRWLTTPDGSRHLFLVRAAKLNEKTVFQGVVLDWPALKATLLDRIPDLLPAADLTPVSMTADTPPEHTMTTLPVRLDAGPTPEPPPAGWTPLRSGLVIAWAAALLAIVAVAFGGRAVVAMSERRVRFASAVTHELRTPLTALQLHLDLLNSGLITDEAKKAEYLATLSAEADRLNRLVENVLDFARLEKQSARASAKLVPVAEVLADARRTWDDRLANEGFELVVENGTEEMVSVVADPRVVAQVLGNLIDNARKYAKSAVDRRVWIRGSAAGGTVRLAVEDRGPGIPSAERKAVFRPFTRGTDTADSGGAGLGLSLARQWVELYGGALCYEPADPTGARFVLTLPEA